MRFWDSSAVVPLLVAEETTKGVQKLYREDDDILAWWGTEVECVSAVARLERTGQMTEAGAGEALSRLHALAASWHQIEPLEPIRESAKRFLRVHDLRTADALQLAAAFVASEGRPSTLQVVCLDERLTAAAGREGFPVIGRSHI